jgi:hypothetical protein
MRKLVNNNGITDGKYYISNVVNRKKLEVKQLMIPKIIGL